MIRIIDLYLLCIPFLFLFSPLNVLTHRYLHRASTIFGGIYLFFITERILRSMESWRKRRRDSQRRKRHLSRASQSGGEAPEVDGRESPDVDLPPICSMHAPSIHTNEEFSDMKIPHAKTRTPKHSESNQALRSPDDQVILICQYLFRLCMCECFCVLGQDACGYRPYLLHVSQ